MNENVVDIGSKDVVQKVHQNVNVQWYKSMLQALQEEAMRLGYLFVKNQAVEELPPIVAERLAYALVLQRERFLCPMAKSGETERKVGHDLTSGYAQQFLRNVLSGLFECGVGLQADKDAPARVKAEGAERDELWGRRADELLSAVRIHVGYELPDLSNEDDKMAMMKTLLGLSEFDNVKQLLFFMKHFAHDRNGQEEWIDARGYRTTTSPDVTFLVTPMLNMSEHELMAITTLALEKLQSNMSSPTLV